MMIVLMEMMMVALTSVRSDGPSALGHACRCGGVDEEDDDNDDDENYYGGIDDDDHLCVRMISPALLPKVTRFHLFNNPE